MFAIICCKSDWEYNYTDLYGIFNTKDAAETSLLKFFENEQISCSLEDFYIKEIEVGKFYINGVR